MEGGGALRGEGLSRELRLRASGEVRAARLRGKRGSSPELAVHVLPRAPGDPAESRFAVSVSRKLGGAVRRNRIKRLLREAWRKRRAALRYRADVLCVARPRAAAVSSLAAADTALARALSQAGIL